MREAAVEPDGDGVTERPLVGDTLGDDETLAVTLADAVCDGDGDTLGDGGDGATVPPQPSG